LERGSVGAWEFWRFSQLTLTLTLTLFTEAAVRRIE
jgi:hypothetical protein